MDRQMKVANLQKSGRDLFLLFREPRPARVPMKRKLMKAEPVRKVVPKPQPTYAKPQQNTIKAPPAVERVKSPKQESPKEPALDGHFELNPFMTRMLDVELQDIMIQVWQALPDDPKTEADKLVTEKFRTDAGDDLRNALSLNVTKRLLNIFNPLNVKIQFSEIPQREHLRAFHKKYSFVMFKRMERTTCTFEAQVKNIKDFDKLCAVRNLRCGNARVAVTPTYRFIECPSKLKTEEKYDIKKKEKPSTNNNEKTEIKKETDNKDTDDSDGKELKVKEEVKKTAENLNKAQVKESQNKESPKMNTVTNNSDKAKQSNTKQKEQTEPQEKPKLATPTIDKKLEDNKAKPIQKPQEKNVVKDSKITPKENPSEKKDETTKPTSVQKPQENKVEVATKAKTTLKSQESKKDVTVSPKNDTKANGRILKRHSIF